MEINYLYYYDREGVWCVTPSLEFALARSTGSFVERVDHEGNTVQYTK